jgi:hypothetical protein
MPRQTAKILPAILAGILAGVSLATMARGETTNAEGCLTSPTAETPPGGHWRYRIDHVNKRNCWYLRQEGGGLSQALPQNSPSAVPSPPPKPSLADAHAELRPQAREDNPVISPPANTAGNQANSANTPVGNTTAAIATRWPDLPAASVPNTTVAAAAPASDTTQPPADLPEAASAADLPASIQPEIIPTLIAATIGALAFAGIAALISRRYRTRLRRRKARAPIWETTDDDRIVLSDYPSMDNRDFQPRFARSAGGAAAASPEFVRRAPRRATR